MEQTVIFFLLKKVVEFFWINVSHQMSVLLTYLLVMFHSFLCVKLFVYTFRFGNVGV